MRTAPCCRTLTATDGVQILDGIFWGSGTINADVVNAGQMMAGTLGTPGILAIYGNYI